MSVRAYSSGVAILLFPGIFGCDQTAGLRELGNSDPKIKIIWSKDGIASLSVSGDNSLQRVLPLIQGSIRIDRIYVQFCKLQTEEIRSLSRIRTLTKLEISGGSIQEQKDLQELKQLPELKVLHLCGCKLDNEVFKHLDGLMNLRYLSLDDNQISSITGLTKINLPELLHLAVASNPIDDEGFKDIVLLPRLEHIHILDTQISVEGCKLAARLLKLRSFAMPNMQIAKQREVKAAFDDARLAARAKGVWMIQVNRKPASTLRLRLGWIMSFRTAGQRI